MSEPAHITVHLHGDPKYLAGVREMVASVARRLGFDELSCSQIALAVDEALCNVIRHGYKDRADKPIWIRIWPEPIGGGHEAASPGLRVVIDDEAQQVDPSCMQGRQLDDIRPGGLGVHIIREVMDEVRYDQREGGKGMSLTLVKRGNVAPTVGVNGPKDGGGGSACGGGPG